MVDLWFEVLVILALLIIGGVFSAGKYAILFVRKSELEDCEKSGNASAKTALELIETPDKISLYVESIIVILTITAVAIGVAFICDDLSRQIAELPPTVHKSFCHWSSIAIIILLIGFLRMIIIETIPRKIAENSSLKLALKAAGPISFIMLIMSIPIAVLNIISTLILKIIRQEKPAQVNGATEEKIIDMIDEGARTGEFDEAEQELIKSVFEFGDTTVSQCMTPRTEMTAINIEDSMEDIIKFIQDEGYSRYPVFLEDLDHIQGIIIVQDLINILYEKKPIEFKKLIRPAFFVPDSRMISDLLKDIQAKQEHLAVVLDEFGGTAGIITIEDIIEELVGEIQDEYDEEEVEFMWLSKDSAEVLARMAVDDFNEEFGSNVPMDLADTIGGAIFTHVGELPQKSQLIKIEDVEFKIISLDGNSIAKVTAKRIGTGD
jgi:magnesium and cobalt exporter, CNNM family